MNKAWSILWLIVASVIAFLIIEAALRPYFFLISVVFTIVVLVFIVVTGNRIISNRRSNRRHF